MVNRANCDLIRDTLTYYNVYLHIKTVNKSRTERRLGEETTYGPAVPRVSQKQGLASIFGGRGTNSIALIQLTSFEIRRKLTMLNADIMFHLMPYIRL